MPQVSPSNYRPCTFFHKLSNSVVDVRIGSDTSEDKSNAAEISQHLFNGLPCKFVQTFMVQIDDESYCLW